MMSIVRGFPPTLQCAVPETPTGISVAWHVRLCLSSLIPMKKTEVRRQTDRSLQFLKRVQNYLSSWEI